MRHSQIFQVQVFSKLNCKISQTYITLTNEFDKKNVLAFYNYFLKIELNYDKENHVNFKYIQFSKGDVV